MGTGWRRAFCTTVPIDRREASAAAAAAEAADKTKNSKSKSNPSTPRLRCKTVSENNSINLVSPKTHSRTRPSSPRSPFSLLKSTLRFSRNSCGVCEQSVKRGQGMAIYTAECSHAFHFPCIAADIRRRSSLVCPVCAAVWRDVPLLSQIPKCRDGERIVRADSGATPTKTTPPVSFSDDEPLLTPKFNPIQIEEEEEVEEFQGFFANSVSSSDFSGDSRAVELRLLPDAVIISRCRTHDTYAVVLNVRAPPPPQIPDAAKRAPIDLVAVLDVSESMIGARIEMLKRAMRLVVASLGSADRLSLLAFSASPKRLLPLRRMSPQGQRSARKIIDRLGCSRGSGCSMAEALREATRALEERRERNPIASIILLSDGRNDGVVAESDPPRGGSPHPTRFTHVEIPSHFPTSENAFSRCVSGLLSVVVQDLRIKLGIGSGSDPAEITAVYSCNERPSLLGSGCIRLGDMYAEEEKELLVEIRVPNSRVGFFPYHVVSAKYSYKDPATQEPVYGREQTLLVPRPQAVRSGSPRIERLRNVFITSRAIAESRRLIEHNELSSAMQLLTSARALLLQSNSELAGEYVRGLDAEVAAVQWRRQAALRRRGSEGREMRVFVDENGEPLTPTSAWRAAEKLADVAHMKKSFNSVRDLYGFENARF